MRLLDRVTINEINALNYMKISGNRQNMTYYNQPYITSLCRTRGLPNVPNSANDTRKRLTLPKPLYSPYQSSRRQPSEPEPYSPLLPPKTNATACPNVFLSNVDFLQ